MHIKGMQRAASEVVLFLVAPLPDVSLQFPKDFVELVPEVQRQGPCGNLRVCEIACNVGPVGGGYRFEG